MDTLEKVNKGIRMFELGKKSELALFKKELRGEDPLALALLEVDLALSRSMPAEAIKRGTRLLPAVADKPELLKELLGSIGSAYLDIGNIETSENYLMRVMDICEQYGDKTGASKVKLLLISNMFSRGDYKGFHKSILELKEEFVIKYYYLALDALVAGKPERCLDNLRTFSEKKKIKGDFYFGMLDLKGLALRLVGKLDEAAETLIESARNLCALGVAYSALPVAKALNLSWFAGTKAPPPNLIKKCLALANRGSYAEYAATQEVKAFLSGSEEEIVRGLFEAAQNYYKAYQNFEACLSGLSAAYMAWQTDNPVFLKSLKFLAPMMPMHPVFKKDPILGRFLGKVEPLINEALDRSDSGEIRAYLIGNLMVRINGNEFTPLHWRSRKAAMFFVYLLLSPKHRIPGDHLFYLLWPKKRFNGKNRELLYQAASFCRRMLGTKSLITQKHDFYQIEGDVWTDLGEFENLLRRADATVDSGEKEELLSRARELAQGELLPEIPYDRYIDEYREYYERLREKLAQTLLPLTPESFLPPHPLRV